MWKRDENGALIEQDGNPVWIYENENGPEKGKEASVDFAQTLTSLHTLRKESVSRKERIRELQGITAKLDAAGIELDGLDEFLDNAKASMDKVQHLTEREAASADEMEKIKQSIADSYTRQIEALKGASKKADTEWQDKLNAKQKAIEGLIIKGAFEQSDFLREKTVMLPDMAYAYFGKHFRVDDEGGQLRGYAVDQNGDKIMSLKNPGQYAEPIEAIEILINEHPQRERLLKMDLSGSGLSPASSGKGNAGAADLLSKYQEAKAKQNIGAMIALKAQMREQGLQAPI